MDKSQLVFRKMEELDLPSVAQIEQSLFSMPWSETSLKEALENSATLYWVALYQGEVIGECGIWHCIDEGEITNVAVKKEYQGNGVGEELLNRVLEEGKKIGIKSYLLEVRKSNTIAIECYKKLQFNIEGIRKNFYEKPLEDAIIMWKR